MKRGLFLLYQEPVRQKKSWIYLVVSSTTSYLELHGPLDNAFSSTLSITICWSFFLCIHRPLMEFSTIPQVLNMHVFKKLDPWNIGLLWLKNNIGTHHQLLIKTRLVLYCCGYRTRRMFGEVCLGTSGRLQWIAWSDLGLINVCQKECFIELL